MCTVTYIKTQDGYILTSSRDEKTFRATVPPSWHIVNGHKLLFPKDVKAGGTWIAQSIENQTACLLNGAFKNHIKKPPYNKSRGIVLLEILGSGNPTDIWQKINLNGIEPFTILSIKEDSFFEFRWDETQKHSKEIDANQPQIWSSATLYNSETIKEREVWFNKWLKEKEYIDSSIIMDFHTAKHSDDALKNVILKRPDGIETVSITQIINDLNEPKMKYKDFVEGIEKEIRILPHSFYR